MEGKQLIAVLIRHRWKVGGILIGLVVHFLCRWVVEDENVVDLVGIFSVGGALVLGLLEEDREYCQRMMMTSLDERLMRLPDSIDNDILRVLSTSSHESVQRNIDAARNLGRYEFQNEVQFVTWLASEVEELRCEREQEVAEGRCSGLRSFRAACSEKAWSLERLMDLYFGRWYQISRLPNVQTKRLFMVRNGVCSPGASKRIREHEANGAPYGILAWEDIVEQQLNVSMEGVLRGLGLNPMVSPSTFFGFVTSDRWVLVHWGSKDRDKMWAWLFTRKRELLIFDELFRELEKIGNCEEYELTNEPDGRLPYHMISRPSRNVRLVKGLYLALAEGGVNRAGDLLHSEEDVVQFATFLSETGCFWGDSSEWRLILDTCFEVGSSVVAIGETVASDVTSRRIRFCHLFGIKDGRATLFGEGTRVVREIALAAPS